MESINGFNMRDRKYILWFIIISIFIIIWKLNSIETEVRNLMFLTETISQNKDQLQLSQQQLALIEHLYDREIENNFSTVYAITPTYTRPVQKAELTRISQTLALVSNIYWIVIEDATEKSQLVTNLLKECNFSYTHLTALTPPEEKSKANKWVQIHKGIEQRNTALRWLRSNFKLGREKGVIYFMDDDNTYNVKLFKEISKVKRVGVWPVGLVGGLNAEAPILDPKTGKVVKWRTGWRPDRPFAIDMAGFAINLDLILEKPHAEFSRKMTVGFIEGEFLSFFTTRDQLEPLADNCTKVYVWHTRTEKPVFNGTVEGLEV